MDLGERVSAAGYRSRAARLRKLAAEATTARAKEYLLAEARQAEAHASGHGTVARPVSSDALGRTTRPRVRR
jgi:hypothetical protein